MRMDKYSKPKKVAVTDEEKVCESIWRWGVGCTEELVFYSHTLRVVDMRTHLTVYEFINKRGIKIGEYQKDDELWRYKAVAAVFGCAEADMNKSITDIERPMFMALVKGKIAQLIGTENEEEQKLLGLLVMRRMLT
jgi:hypothetical protein